MAERNWARISFLLVAGTLGYNLVEAVIAIWSGERADSIALLGFGLDSIIECSAAGVVLWRVSVEARGRDPEHVEAAERRVRRFVGGTFLALAFYILAEAGWGLWKREAPAVSPVGIGLAVTSLLIMPALAWGKLTAARGLRSRSLEAEARETFVCSLLSFALLLGLAANATAGWWWADPVAALAMIPWLVKEGLEGLKGEECGDECHDEKEHHASRS